jgi:hypothetical protein
MNAQSAAIGPGRGVRGYVGIAREKEF